VYGITYSSEQGLLGGWSEYIYLKPGVKILRLPESVTPEIYISGTEYYVYLFSLIFDWLKVGVGYLQHSMPSSAQPYEWATLLLFR